MSSKPLALIFVLLEVLIDQMLYIDLFLYIDYHIVQLSLIFSDISIFCIYWLGYKDLDRCLLNKEDPNSDN